MSKVKACRLTSAPNSASSKRTTLRRVASTPVSIPSATLKRNAHTAGSGPSLASQHERRSPVTTPPAPQRRKSILKNAFVLNSVDCEHTPANSPDLPTARTRRMSQVRFSDYVNDESHGKSRDNNSDCDSLNDDWSDTELDDCVGSSSLPSLTFSVTMSPEAHYAALKTYEDEFYDKLHKLCPDVAERLTNNDTPDSDLEDCYGDHQPLDSSPNAHKVVTRLQLALEVMDSMREQNDHSRRTRVSKPATVRSFEKWCQSLRNSLVNLDLSTEL